jgi:hypothetical protein
VWVCIGTVERKRYRTGVRCEARIQCDHVRPGIPNARARLQFYRALGRAYYFAQGCEQKDFYFHKSFTPAGSGATYIDGLLGLFYGLWDRMATTSRGVVGRQTKIEADRSVRSASILISELYSEPYGWQEGKKVLDTILLAWPLVALAPGLK